MDEAWVRMRMNWLLFGLLCCHLRVKQGTRTVIFAQASPSRLGKSSKSLPRSFVRSTRLGEKTDFERKSTSLRRGGLA